MDEYPTGSGFSAHHRVDHFLFVLLVRYVPQRRQESLHSHELSGIKVLFVWVRCPDELKLLPSRSLSNCPEFPHNGHLHHVGAVVPDARISG